MTAFAPKALLLAAFVALGPVAAQAETLYVQNGVTLNGRKGPGTQHMAIASLSGGAALSLLERSGRWVKVRTVEGLVLWVHVDYLTPVAPQPKPKSSAVAPQPQPQFPDPSPPRAVTPAFEPDRPTRPVVQPPVVQTPKPKPPAVQPVTPQLPKPTTPSFQTAPSLPKPKPQQAQPQQPGRPKPGNLPQQQDSPLFQQNPPGH
jgi:hypothetical protein